MAYDHLQRGYWHWLLYGLALVECGGAVFAWRQAPEFVAPLLAGMAALFAVLALAFHYQRVSDGGDRLIVQYGPLPLLRGSFAYAEITTAEAGRTTILDGWGIHWVPGRGWTYNIWGYDCVVLTVRGKTIRVGTDDVSGLLGFLRTKLGYD